MAEGGAGMRTFQAVHGLAWLTAGLQLLGRQPFRLLLLGLVLQLLAGLTQAGALGVLFVLSVPALTAGILRAMYMADCGQRPPLAVLFSAFGAPDRLLRLVLLGGLMLAAGAVGVMLALSGLLADVGPDVMARLEQGDVEALLNADPQALQRLMFALLAGLVVSGALSYFAIPLIAFGQVPLGSALLQGLLGMLRNWRPFLVMGLMLVVLAAPVIILSALVLGLSAAGAESSHLLTLLMLFTAVVYQLVLFATQYVAFKEIFGLAPPAEQTTGDDSQLVA